MYKFLAKRIHDGFLTLNEVPKKYRAKVAEAYEAEYGTSE